MCWKLLVHYYQFLFLKKEEKPAQTTHRLTATFVRVTIMLIIMFGAIGGGTIIIQNNPNAVASIPSVNYFLMKIDQPIFNTSLPLWFQLSTNPYKPLFDKASVLLIYTYYSLSYLFGLTLLLLALVNARSCVKLIASFAVCAFISMPFWYLFPATSPVIAYLYPASETVIPRDITPVLNNYQPNEDLQNFFKLRTAANSNGPYTTIPSMHIAWVTVLVFYTAIAWRPLAIIGIPYFFLNTLSTVYTLQHYTADILAGLIVAVLAIVIIKRIKPEKVKSIAFILETVQDDTAFIKKKLGLFMQKTEHLLSRKSKLIKESD